MHRDCPPDSFSGPGVSDSLLEEEGVSEQFAQVGLELRQEVLRRMSGPEWRPIEEYEAKKDEKALLWVKDPHLGDCDMTAVFKHGVWVIDQPRELYPIEGKITHVMPRPVPPEEASHA